jgi:hypothetical protein
MNDRPDTKDDERAPSAASQDPSAETRWVSVNGRQLVRNVFVVCLVTELLFVFLDATVNYAGWTSLGMVRRMWNIAREDSLPSWFGTTQTCMVALTLWLIFAATRRDRRSRTVVIGWFVLACLFTYMAADDGAEIHERVGSAFKKVHASDNAYGAIETWGDNVLRLYPSYAWQLVFVPFFGLLGAFMLVFLWRELSAKRARMFVVLALLLMTLCVAMDFVEGLDPDHRWNLYTILGDRTDPAVTLDAFGQLPYDTFRHFSKSIEEFLEMLAHTILWVVFLAHLMRTARFFAVRFTDVPLSNQPAAIRPGPSEAARLDDR